METLLKVIALLSSGLFAGAALYTTAVEHPARVSQGVLIALQEIQAQLQASSTFAGWIGGHLFSLQCGRLAADGPMDMARRRRVGRRSRPIHLRLHNVNQSLIVGCRFAAEG
jgi:hypothetical protein